MAEWVDGSYEIEHRYWVCEKNAGAGWTVYRKTNWLWRALQIAEKRSRAGFRMKVEAKW